MAQPSTQQPWVQIGQAFLSHYYHCFDGDRAQLAPLYKDNSQLTSEKETFQGSGPILESLAKLPRMAHNISSAQFQPTLHNGILMLINGDIKLHGQEHPLKFSQCFQLASDGGGNFYIQNDIFSLNYG